MTGKKAVIQLLLFCGAMGLSGCAGKPPTATLSQADLAVQQASKSKAPEYASLELYTAREQFTGAQEAMHNAGRQARLKAGAERTLEAVACMPWFG